MTLSVDPSLQQYDNTISLITYTEGKCSLFESIIDFEILDETTEDHKEEKKDEVLHSKDEVIHVKNLIAAPVLKLEDLNIPKKDGGQIHF